MKTFKLISSVFVVAFMVAGCKGKSSSNTADVGGSATGTTTTQDVIISLHYFRGGGFAPNPTWDRDMTIDFLSFNNSQYLVTAEVADPLCFKTGGITVAETSDLFYLYSNLLLMTSNGPQTADYGVEYIEVTTSTGIVRRFYLDNHEVPAGEQFAINPNALSDYLKDLEASLAVACQ